MTGSRILLRKLLDALVKEWGAYEVSRALSELSNVEGFDQKNKRGANPKKLLSAVDQVERAHMAENQKAMLRDIAERFDQKQFLPSIVDVREFLIMTSHRPGAMKNRSDAFRYLLKVLMGFSNERLRQLVMTSRHSGPSRLGPLSDAISEAGSLLPRRRETDAD